MFVGAVSHVPHGERAQDAASAGHRLPSEDEWHQWGEGGADSSSSSPNGQPPLLPTRCNHPQLPTRRQVIQKLVGRVDRVLYGVVASLNR